MSVGPPSSIAGCRQTCWSTVRCKTGVRRLPSTAGHRDSTRVPPLEGVLIATLSGSGPASAKELQMPRRPSKATLGANDISPEPCRAPAFAENIRGRAQAAT